MISFRAIELSIVNGLQEWLHSKEYIHCPVIRANQTAKVPDYPYLSYTVTTPVSSDMGGYSVAEDGTRYKSVVQTWSFTAQSGDDEESMNVAMLAYDFFALTGNTYLSDNGIVAQNVGNVTNRDNLLTIEYEYRRGFDVEFSLLQTLEKEDCETAGYINTAEIKANEEV